MNAGFASDILRSRVFTTSKTVGVLKTQPRWFVSWFFFNMIEYVSFAGSLVLVNSGLLLTSCDFTHATTSSDQSECRCFIFSQSGEKPKPIMSWLCFSRVASVDCAGFSLWLAYLSIGSFTFGLAVNLLIKGPHTACPNQSDKQEFHHGR